MSHGRSLRLWHEGGIAVEFPPCLEHGMGSTITSRAHVDHLVFVRPFFDQLLPSRWVWHVLVTLLFNLGHGLSAILDRKGLRGLADAGETHLVENS